jgi:hypothetical protein
MKHDEWKLLPERLRRLPIDPRRALPIPFTTPILPDGTGQWGITSTELVGERCWRDKLCGVCGDPLPFWIAFVGGPGSADRWRGAYTDPWMHEQCAEASIKICPYIARPKVPRVSDTLQLPLAIPDGEVPGKARGDDSWVMVICRRDLVESHVERSRATGSLGDPIRVFMPGSGNPRRERRWSYQGNNLVEQGSVIA